PPPGPRPSPGCRPPRPQLQPERLAVLYRQLRKAQEDAKNEPGAADFYYGEMEMRRHATTVRIGERILLLLYWLTSVMPSRRSASDPKFGRHHVLQQQPARACPGERAGQAPGSVAGRDRKRR